MKHFFAVIALSIATTVSAQTAKVVALSPEDAAQAKALYDAQQKANKQLDDFRQAITNKYAMEDREEGHLTGVVCGEWTKDGLLQATPCKEPKTPPKKVMRRVLKEGWFYGFAFSEDFKFIVPEKQTEYKQPQTWFGGGNYICPAWGGTINPAWVGATSTPLINSN